MKGDVGGLFSHCTEEETWPTLQNCHVIDDERLSGNREHRWLCVPSGGCVCACMHACKSSFSSEGFAVSSVIVGEP